jgi:hypothetical protein
MPFGDDNKDNDEYIVCVEDSATNEIMLEWWIAWKRSGAR